MIDSRTAAIACGAAVLTIALARHATAAPPKLRADPPVIHLADNLDEKDELGWCVDTLGRGFSEQIQAHSCKPGSDGGEVLDVSFLHDAATGQIRSAAYDGKCVAVRDASSATIPFGLEDCAPDEPSQRFDYDAATMAIHPAGDVSLCMAVAPASREAGPFMSRDLVLVPCGDTAAELREWVIAAG